MATDPNTLTDPKLLRALADNARSKGREDIAFACMVRIAELAGQAYQPGVEREFWQAIAVAEELLSAQSGKTIRLSRTRQKLARVGLMATVRDLAKAPKLTEGFRILVEGQRADLTAEAIVVRHFDYFDPGVVEAAKLKLTQVGVDIPYIEKIGVSA